MSREIVVEQKVCDLAEADGWLVRKCVYAGRRGSPDRWFFRDGRVVLIEFKRAGQFPDAQQQREHDRLAAQGFTVHVVRDVASGLALLL